MLFLTSKKHARSTRHNPCGERERERDVTKVTKQP